MGRFQEALEDAESALAINDRGPTAHYIRGICLSNLGQPKDAIDSFEVAGTLDIFGRITPKLPPLIIKARAAIEDLKSGKKAVVTPKRQRVKEDIVKDDSDEGDGETLMKGYKTLSDGSKTSYFTHEMTEQERNLAGNFTPKAITREEADKLKKQAEETTGAGSWWAGETWEEIKQEKWIREQVRARISSLFAKVPGMSHIVRVDNIDGWDGGGYVMVKRQVKKFIIDVTFTVHWAATTDNPSDEAVIGNMEYKDITNAEIEEGSINPKISIRTPLKAVTHDRFQTALGDMKTKVQEELIAVLRDFKKLL